MSSNAASDTKDHSNLELPGHLKGLSVRRQVLVIAIWPLLEQLLGFLVGFVDTAIAGRLSVAATEAIAVAAYTGWLLVLMFGAIGIGAAALVSRAIGGRHRRLANAALGQAVTCCLIMGLLLAVIVYIVAPWISALMNLTGESLRLATAYLRVIALAAPANGVLFVINACLRASGDTKTPFRTLAIVNIFNIVLSCTFVFGPEPFGGHGVKGIAAGTAVAWCVGMCLALRAVLRGKSPIRLRLPRLWPEPNTLRRILKISFPQFLDSLIMWTGNFSIASIVGYIGRTEQTGALAAHVIVIRVEALSYLPGWALAVAAATLTGQYLGLGDKKRARQATGYCLFLAATAMGSMGVIFMMFPEPLVRLVTSEPRLLELTPQILRICGPAQIFFAAAMVLDQALRGAGDTRVATLIVGISTIFIRLPAAYFVGVTLGGGVAGIWLAICSELALRAVITTGYYTTGRWARVKV